MGCLCKELAGDELTLASRCIGDLWIFRELAPADLRQLVQDAFRRKFSRNRKIFLQGDPADEIMLIKAGRVRLVKVFEDGTEVTLDIRSAGDFIGENMLSETGEYPLSAVCMEETLICGFTRNQFEQLILNNPQVGLQVIRNLSRRIASLSDRIGSLSASHLEERLYRVLSGLANDHGINTAQGRCIDFPLTHEDIGFLTGAHRVSVTRTLKALRESGKIIEQERKFILPPVSA